MVRGWWSGLAVIGRDGLGWVGIGWDWQGVSWDWLGWVAIGWDWPGLRIG